MLDPSILQFLQQLSQTSGYPKYSSDGLFNVKLPTKPYSGTTEADKAKYDAEVQRSQGLNSLLNSGLNTAANSQLELFTNKEQNKTNPYAVGDVVSKGALEVASKIPGVGGLIGTGLNIANTLFAQKVKKDESGLNMLSESSGFTGAQEGQGANLEKVDKFNSAGLLGQLFTKKANRKKGLLAEMNAWKSLGKKAKSLKNQSDRSLSNALSVDSLGQQATLTESGFPEQISFGKKGLIFMEKNSDVEFYRKRNRTDLIRKINDIYSLNRNLMSKIESVRKILEEKPVSLKDGGPINLIVDGQLHAHKHQIKTKQEFKKAPITPKGVPVVTMSEGGDIDQQQEVERDELILHFDLTKKMEELAKDGSDEQMIEAGKLLAKEILRNTKDNKNKLLKTVQ